MPTVDYGGQGGLGDVVVHPDFADNGLIYLSYAEAGDGDTRGAAVARARLALDDAGGGRLSDVEVIWRQVPKVSGRGHYGHRIAFGPDGHLWISSGERQKFDPAQDMQSNLGKIVRLNDDGSVPADNPFVDDGEVAAQVWSLGHRNPLGIAFDAQGRLWNSEMGPAGGDELNLVERGGNYGYPVVSNGDHYDGKDIPDHGSAADTGFIAPKTWWTPVISPSSLVFYRGEEFADWNGDALIGGLSSQALVRVEIDGDSAKEVARYPMGQRIRGVEQAPVQFARPAEHLLVAVLEVDHGHVHHVAGVEVVADVQVEAVLGVQALDLLVEVPDLLPAGGQDRGGVDVPAVLGEVLTPI